MEELPLRPLIEEPPCGPGIKQALATFSMSAVLGAGALVFLLPATHTCGASRSARLKRVEAAQALEAAERACDANPGSTPSK